MNKIPIFVAALIAAVSTLSAETVPSLVIEHWYGNDSYPVSLSDFNRIEIGDDHYTLKANHSGVQDQTLSYSQYPRFYVADVDQKDIVTSDKRLTAPASSPGFAYNPAAQELTSLTGEPFTATIFNLGGQTVLRGTAAQGVGLSVATLPAGVYIAVHSDNGAVEPFKFHK